MNQSDLNTTIPFDSTEAETPSDESVEAYNRGVDKSDLGDKQGAIDDYTLAINLNPNDDKAYNNRGIAKSDLGDDRGAIDDYTLAIDLNPNS
jgi:tetratricopeptide (TPR) repeat protein